MPSMPLMARERACTLNTLRRGRGGGGGGGDGGGRKGLRGRVGQPTVFSSAASIAADRPLQARQLVRLPSF